MDISIPLNNVNPQYIYFAEKKNNVIVAGDFIKLIYSTSGFEMTGLYILFGLNKRVLSPRLERVNYNTLRHSLSAPDCSIHMRTTNIRSMDDGMLTKHTLSFDPYSEQNYYTIQKLCSLEHEIIGRYIVGKNKTKMASYILKNQMLSGSIKCHSESRNRKYNTVSSEIGTEQIILKISGIWETDANVGITMKFMVLRDEVI